MKRIANIFGAVLATLSLTAYASTVSMPNYQDAIQIAYVETQQENLPVIVDIKEKLDTEMTKTKDNWTKLEEGVKSKNYDIKFAGKYKHALKNTIKLKISTKMPEDLFKGQMI